MNKVKSFLFAVALQWGLAGMFWLAGCFIQWEWWDWRIENDAIRLYILITLGFAALHCVMPPWRVVNERVAEKSRYL